MDRLIAALQTSLLLAGLLFLAIPADLACCAGVAEIHGPSCCESAEEEARARSCCEGKEAATALRIDPPVAPTALISVSLPLTTVLDALVRSPLLAAATYELPSNGDLFTLHSALLL